MEVPCGSCTACCTSSQFIHIGPDETDTLARIPAALLFPAPRFPRGHFLLGYDERGHCPMFVDNRCSIYEHRPRACRTYDCRVLPAAGLDLDDDDRKLLIAQQARQLRFTYPEPLDRTKQEAVIAAAAFLERRPDLLSGRDFTGIPPATQLAVLAVRIAEAFLAPDEETGDVKVVEPDPEVVRELLSRVADTG